jgi:DNA-binding CsgD family transcriptional regulator
MWRRPADASGRYNLPKVQVLTSQPAHPTPLIGRDLGVANNVAAGLDGLAAVAARRGMPRGRRTFWARPTRCSQVVSISMPCFRTSAQTVSAVRGMLADDALAAARAAGHALPLQQAITGALSGNDERKLISAEPDDSTANSSFSSLRPSFPDCPTAREVNVLRLIAQGKNTREIAETLVIAEGTVERHITNIYAKIGGRGRADATAYALTRGLAPNPPIRQPKTTGVTRKHLHR